MQQECTLLPHEIDHIRARKQHGPTTLENLCWACAECNGHKGANVAGFDPETGELAILFNPRRELWAERFAWDGPKLLGKTDIGRATIDVLQINLPARIEFRRLLIQLGLFPHS
jgi:hypothetical protein